MAEGERFESEGSTEAKGEELQGRTERNSENETNEEAKREKSDRGSVEGKGLGKETSDKAKRRKEL